MALNETAITQRFPRTLYGFPVYCKGSINRSKEGPFEGSVKGSIGVPLWGRWSQIIMVAPIIVETLRPTI